VQRLSHLPILVDPSHGTGKRDSVLPMARAAIACGADGILVEVHHQPEKALSDGPQSIYPDQFARMMDEIAQIAPVVASHPAPRHPRRSADRPCLMTASYERSQKLGCPEPAGTPARLSRYWKAVPHPCDVF
jgi:hypothetical protein